MPNDSREQALKHSQFIIKLSFVCKIHIQYLRCYLKRVTGRTSCKFVFFFCKLMAVESFYVDSQSILYLIQGEVEMLPSG